MFDPTVDRILKKKKTEMRWVIFFLQDKLFLN